MKIDLHRVMTIDSLIRHQSTGNPENLARRLGISKRTLFDTLNFMRDALDAPISYNRYRQTYIYKKEGTLQLKFQSEESVWVRKAIIDVINGALILAFLSNMEFLQFLDGIF